MRIDAVRRRRPALIAAAAALAALCLSGGDSQAQYFGRNKVQWEKFDWRVLKTEHFDVHYYPDEEEAVRDAARMAERWYDRLSRAFGHELLERKPLIFYADASDFQQTTVIGGLIGQGTGGVTESLRSRVIMPLTGSYEETDHVLGHELVHVFQYEILLGRRPEDNRPEFDQQAQRAQLPLWFIEGLAEYLSLGRHSPQSSMWLRDAMLHDDLPDLDKMSRNPRYFPYRWGHAFWAYVGGRWGDQAVARMFTAGAHGGVDTALAEVAGRTPKDFSDEWRAAIRETYQPALDQRVPPQNVGTRLIERKAPFVTDIAPVVSPDGTQLVFLSTRNLFSFELFLADARTGEIKERLISSESNQHFEALRFLDSAGSFSPDGKKFAFAVFARGDNEIAVLDVGSRKIERRIAIPGVGSIWNPAWSPDGRSIAFAGSTGGLSDLYLLDLDSAKARQLTADRFADLQPDWTPDGRSIVFASDRGPGTDFTQLSYGKIGLWRLDLASGRVSELLAAEPDAGDRINPQLGPDGHDVYFLEIRDGVTDLFRAPLDGGPVTRLTRIGTGVSGVTRYSPALSVAEKSGRILFSVFDDKSYAIHALEPAQAKAQAPAPEIPETTVLVPSGDLPPARPTAAEVVADYLADPAPVPAPGTGFEEADYRPGLGLDFIAPSAGVAVSSLGYAVGGDISAFWGDMLGQHQVGATLYGASGGALDEIGAQGYYLNRESRWNWGIQGGHIPFITARTFVTAEPVEIEGEVFAGRRIEQIRQIVTLDQATAITHYPFSSTRRLELGAGLTQLGYELESESILVVGNTVVDRDRDDLPAPDSLSLYQGTVALVGDTSNFGYTSPVRGTRYRLEVEPTFGDLEFQSVLGDYRRYLFFRPVTLAARGLYFGRFGSDSESPRLAPLYLGEDTLVRGYDLSSFDISECTALPGDPTACPEFDRLVGSRIGLFNLELRFPLFGTEGYGLFEVPFLPIELAAFVDAGAAWTQDLAPDLRFDQKTLDRVPVVSAGIAARVLLGGFAVLQFYYAKPFQRPEEDWVSGFFIAPGW